MGLFGKLFDKKECSICGGEIGLLGNRKLEDGNLCKECAKKLSPWFDDRRHSTVDQIAEQLEYREANKEKVAAFRTTRVLGESTKVMLDEDAGVFMVTSSRNYAEENPDVLAFSDVTGCELDIEEDSTEITRTNAEGEEVSYNPPRYVYEYDFYMNIHVRNPYFDDMRFKLNNSSVRIEDNGGMNRGTVRSMGMGMNRNMNMDRGMGMSRSMNMDRGMGMNRNMGGYGGQMNPEQDIEFRQYKEMGEEIKAALMQVRQQAREEMAAAAAPKAAVTCPFCGATTTPDANGCCEFCGGAVNG